MFGDDVQTPERRTRPRPGSLVLLSDPPIGLTHKERSRTTECPRVVSVTSQASALKSKSVFAFVSLW